MWRAMTNGRAGGRGRGQHADRLRAVEAAIADAGLPVGLHRRGCVAGALNLDAPFPLPWSPAEGVSGRDSATGLGSTARCCGRRRHRQANSVRVCSSTSRRVASLRPRSAGLTALTPAPRTLVQTGSCRRCSLIHPLHVVVDVLSRMTLFRATVDNAAHARHFRPLTARRRRLRLVAV